MADKKPDIYAIFNEAVERESDDERLRFLDEACQNDPQVRGKVETLLRAHSDAGNFLGGGTQSKLPPPSTSPPPNNSALSSAHTNSTRRSPKVAWAVSTWPSKKNPFAAR